MIEFKASEVSTFVKSFQRQILVFGLVLGSSSVLLLSGCSSALNSGLKGGPSTETVTASVKGITHGGQSPVSGSTVRLYEVGATSASAGGYGAAVTEIATADSPTDNGGNWSISSFTCNNSGDELYLVSSGGNPGLTAGTANSALVLTAAMGSCSATPSYVVINEITTVVTEYALAGFATDYLHIGTSKNNTVGLTNAFATVNNLVNVATGNALTATPAYATTPVSCATTPTACTPTDTFRSITPIDLIGTLANALADCVNTNGDTSSTTSGCGGLFAITGGSLATPTASISNTADAALYIAHNPGLPSNLGQGSTNLQALLNLSTSSTPFSPALSATPNDYTMTVNYVGGGLGGVTASSESSPQNFAIDDEGNLWVVAPGIAGLAELNSLGAPVTPSTTVNTTAVNTQHPNLSYPAVTKGGYRPAGFATNTARGISVDLNGNLWIADASNCLIGIYGAKSSNTGTGLPNSPFASLCPAGATQTSVDATGNVWVMGENFLNSATNTGTALVGDTTDWNTLGNVVGPDYTGHIWFNDEGNGSYGALTTSTAAIYEHTGSLLAADTPYFAMGAYTGSSSKGTLAMWLPQPADGNVTQVTIGSGAAALPSFQIIPEPPTVTVNANGIAADGLSNYYIASVAGNTGASTQAPTNITVYTSGSQLVSPALTGYTGGSALMELAIPTSVHVDQSGNLWVLNTNNANYNTNPPAGGSYLGNGTNAGNLTEFVGLAAPVNPVAAECALAGQNFINGGGTATTVMTAPGTYGNRP